METSALTDILERIQSPNGSADGLTRLREWLHDSRNLDRAAAEADVFVSIVRVLIASMGQQLSMLVRSSSTRKTTTFKPDGASCLQQVVRAACRYSGRRPNQAPLLGRSMRKLWEHLAEMLSSEAISQKHPSVLPYYGRIVKELAERSALGYLSEMRGERLRMVLRALLHMPTAESQAVGFEAAAQLLLRVNGDPGNEVPWLCDRLVELMGIGSDRGASCVPVLSAAAHRCTFDFRDWLVHENNAERLLHAAFGIWSLRSSEGLDLVLVIVLQLVEPPALQQAAHGLLPLAVEALEAVVRTAGDTAAYDAIRSPRVARLAHLLCLAVRRAEGSLEAAISKVALQLEQRCLPWALCAVAMCEVYAQSLCTGEAFPILRQLVEALQAQLSRFNRLRAHEVAAVCAALAAALTAPAFQSTFEGCMDRPASPSSSLLYAHETGLSSLFMDVLQLRSTWLESFLPASWTPLLQQLIDQVMVALSQGCSGCYPLLSAILLVAPATLTDEVSRQILAMQAGPSSFPSGSSAAAPSDPAARCCALTAASKHRPSVGLQGDLIRAMLPESVDLRLLCLRVCCEDHGSGSQLVGPQDSDRRPGSSALMAKEFRDDFSGGLARPEERSASDPPVWQQTRTLWTLEAKMVDAVLDGQAAAQSIAGAAGSPDAGVALDSCRAFAVSETLAFRSAPAAVHLGWADAVYMQPPQREAAIAQRPTNAAACAAVVDLFRAQQEACFANGSDPSRCSQSRDMMSSLAARLLTLLSSMTLLIRLAWTPATAWLQELQTALVETLGLLCDLPTPEAVGAGRAHRSIIGLHEALLKFLIAIDQVSGDAAQTNFWEQDPRLLEKAADLAASLSARWFPTREKEEADAFGARADPSAVKTTAPVIPRASSLRLLVALACIRCSSTAPRLVESRRRIIAALQDLLSRTARLESALVLPVLRLISAELRLHRDRLHFLPALLEALRTSPEPLCSQDFEDAFLVAFRFLTIASADREVLQATLKSLWTSPSGREAKMLTLLSRWRGDTEWLAPRGKIILASILTKTLELLNLVKGEAGCENIRQTIAEQCMNCVPHLLLADRNSEVRFGVARSCTKPLFQLFDDEQVYGEVSALFKAVPRGSPVKSEAFATIQVMLETAMVSGYLHCIVPQLCNLPAALRAQARLALRVLDLHEAARRGCSSSSSCSTVALMFRTEVFAEFVRQGGHLRHFPFAELGMDPVAGGSMLVHLPFAVSALALTNAFEQLSDLAESCGVPPQGGEFLELIFVPLAGTLIPLRRSLELLTATFGSERVSALSKQMGHEVLAFSWQLPFLTAKHELPIKPEAIRSAFEELGPSSPWSEFSGFVSLHYRTLVTALDRVLCTACSWAPVVAADLLRVFASWAGVLNAARLRMFLPMLVRHGLAMPDAQCREMSTIAEVVLDKSPPAAVVKLACHQDQSLRSILAAVEQRWQSRLEDSEVKRRTADPKTCVALNALQALLRMLRKQNAMQEAEWLRLSVEALMTRLQPAAAELLGQALGGVVEQEERASKRQRTSDSATGSLSSLCSQQHGLNWGVRPSPDLGALAAALTAVATSTSSSSSTPSSKSRGAPSEAQLQSSSLLGHVLRLLLQPELMKQLGRNSQLAVSICVALSCMDPSAVVQLSLETQADSVEAALQAAMQSARGDRSKGLGVDELLCCTLLLGASTLQVHPSSRVREMAVSTLRHVAGLKQFFAPARSTLLQVLDKRHVCLEDLADLKPTEAASSSTLSEAPAGAASLIGACDDGTGKSKEIEKPSWDELFTAPLGSCGKVSGFDSWVCRSCSMLLALATAEQWEKKATGLLPACTLLASQVDWFAERVLVLLILKASMHPKAGMQVARAMTQFFCQASVEPMKAQCLLKALHLVRFQQTRLKGRCVPHFPDDRNDPFWACVDLCAVASSASDAGWPRDGLLFLELHLGRDNPDVAIGHSLLKGNNPLSMSVVELFKPLSREVQLLHRLAQQLPEDELLYGVSEWCHASSRLTRSMLSRDHLASLYLRNDLRAAELSSHSRSSHAGGSGNVTDVELDAALADLGLHSVLVGGSAPPADAASSVWDRRMEALWRLRQWDAVSEVDSFNSQLHSALSNLAQHPQQPLKEVAVAAVEEPMVGLASRVLSGVDVGSPEQLRGMAVKLQMLGSVFDFLQVAGGASLETVPSEVVSSLATKWQPRTPPGLSDTRFRMLEPLHSLRATLLSLAKAPKAEMRFLTSFAEAAREVGQSHRALGLLERAQGLSMAADCRVSTLQLHMEQARCFWDLQQQQQAICIASAVAAECRARSSAGSPLASASPGWMSSILSETGAWLSIARLAAGDEIQRDFLNPAVSMDSGSVQPRRRLADFLDARLAEELARRSSLEQAMYSDLQRRTQVELDSAQKELQTLERSPQGREQEITTLKEQIRSIQNMSERDKSREEGTKTRLRTLSTQCVHQLGQCLVQDSGAGSMTKVACRFLSLWFDHGREFPEVTQSVKECLSQLQLEPIIPFIYQIASRLGGTRDTMQETLEELLARLGNSSAQALWPLLLLRNGDQVPKTMRGAARFVPDTSKIEAATRLLDRLRALQAVRPLLEAVEVLSKFYLSVAYFTVDKKNRDTEVALQAVPPYKEVKKILARKAGNIPVPTATVSSSSSGAGSASRGPFISHFKDHFGIAKQGLSAPRIVSLYDTEGREHRQCVKGMDDVRQDAVMQQLFRGLNEIFLESSRARQVNLSLRTFQVVPLSPCAGMMEWVLDTVTLGEMLTGNTNPNEGAHTRYRPGDWPHAGCRRHMQLAHEAQMKGKAGALNTAFKEVCEVFRPVMHLAFLEYFPTPQEWHRARQCYARSAAVTSMVGHVVGIGDRHPNNILFDYRTGELVHIDFGIVFDQGRTLRVPELVPFRLTRDMVAVLGCLGTYGPFQRNCEVTLDVLRSNASLVTAITEVFVHDPVYHWSLGKNRARQSDAGGEEDNPGWPLLASAVGAGASASEGNEMARRALLVVKGKLHGEEHEGARALGVAAQVGWLLHEAMEPVNLANMYFGWSPWL